MLLCNICMRTLALSGHYFYPNGCAVNRTEPENGNALVLEFFERDVNAKVDVNFVRKC